MREEREEEERERDKKKKKKKKKKRRGGARLCRKNQEVFFQVKPENQSIIHSLFHLTPSKKRDQKQEKKIDK